MKPKSSGAKMAPDVKKPKLVMIITAKQPKPAPRISAKKVSTAPAKGRKS